MVYFADSKGPPASAIRAMGSKSASKDIMMKANVPLIPGY
jgi:3-methylcrotonyl-CoA carboxylase alpha subunit